MVLRGRRKQYLPFTLALDFRIQKFLIFGGMCFCELMNYLINSHRVSCDSRGKWTAICSASDFGRRWSGKKKTSNWRCQFVCNGFFFFGFHWGKAASLFIFFFFCFILLDFHVLFIFHCRSLPQKALMTLARRCDCLSSFRVTCLCFAATNDVCVDLVMTTNGIAH